MDSADSHKKFIEKHGLPFTLIADTDKLLVNEMGVWGEKSMYGRKYMGTFRTTFVIDEEGVIEKVFSPKEVKTKTHGEQRLRCRWHSQSYGRPSIYLFIYMGGRPFF